MAKHLSFSTIYNVLFTPFQEPNFDHILDLTQRSKAQESVIPKKLKNLLGTNEPDEALLTRLKNFLSQYDADKALVSKLFGENFAFQQNNNQTKLIQIFSELNSEYAFFKDDSKLQDFIRMRFTTTFVTPTSAWRSREICYKILLHLGAYRDCRVHLGLPRNLIHPHESACGVHLQ